MWHIHSTLPIMKWPLTKKMAITKENLCTKYTPFTYKYVTLNEKLPMTKQNLHRFFFIIGRVECIWHLRDILVSGTYMAITPELAVAFGYVLAHTYKNVGSVWPFGIMTVSLICNVVAIFV